MAIVPLRLLGILLLALAIVVPSCQAVFAHAAVEGESAAEPVGHGR